MTSAPRLALQYSLLFAANGVTLPFAGLWLRGQGLSGGEIGVLLALPMFGRLVTGPLLAIWADGFKYRRTPIALLGLAMAAGYGGAGLVEGFWLWALFWFIGATAAAALIPLSDVLTLKLAKRQGFNFSLPRGFGSAAFVIANVVVGWWLSFATPDAVIVWSATAALLIAVTAWRFLPAEPVHDGPVLAGRERFSGLNALLRDRIFMMAIFSVGSIQAAHGFYYVFSAISWKAQGISETMTGLLWAFSVVVEIAFMWVIEPWRRRAGITAWTMLMIGGGAAMLRWSLLAFAPPLWALWPLQTLHALSFAATYLAGVQIVERLCPPQNHTAAQTLGSSVSAGLLIGLATLISGPLYDQFGLKGYWAMTIIAGAGVIMGLILKPALGEPRRP
jgi:PPP family 3-phenylpropionic acid transporter